MYCQFCGTRLRHLARYCRNCGARLIREEDDPSPATPWEPVPAQDDGDVPWRGEEPAVILPIVPLAPVEEPRTESEEESGEIVPIELPAEPPQRKEPAEREEPARPAPPRLSPTPLPAPPKIEQVGTPWPDIQEYFASTVATQRAASSSRRSRSGMLLLLLLVAVILLFLFASLVWRAV